MNFSPKNNRSGSLALAAAVSLFWSTQSLAFQDAASPTLTVPTDPSEAYEKDPKSDEDLLKFDPPVESRVAVDAGRIADAAGTELGAKLTPLLATLFNAEKSDADRLKAAEGLKEAVRELDGDEDRAKQSVSRQVLRRVRMAEAAISGLRDSNADKDVRKLVNDFVVRAAIDSENGNRLAHMELARRHFEKIRRNHPVVYGRIQPVLMEEYLNYNLHFVVSEPILTRMVSDFRTETGNVAECILGAWVTGCQVTDTMIRADIKPSLTTGAFDLIVEGRTMSNTKGHKSPAVVYTRGNHYFSIVKPTYFDGQKLTSDEPVMDVRAHNQTVGVSTKYDRIPIIGGIANSIAQDEVAKKKQQSEAIAARKIADGALPRFQQEVLQKFDEANANMESNLLSNLRKRNIAPGDYSARSSETHLAVSSRTLGTGALSGATPPSLEPPRRGIAVQMHQSAMNAAIDSLGISGQMTVQQVLDRIEVALEELTQKDVSLRDSDAAKDDKTEFDFEEKDGIRVRFEENRVIFILRTGFYQKDKDRRIPRHSFEIPIGLEFQDGELVLIPPKTDTKGILSIKPQAIEEKSSLRTIVQARAIAKELLDKMFKEEKIKIDPTVEVKMGDGQKMKMKATTVEMSDGWVQGILE
ncbi:MAG: hypothetical protein R3C49_26135 [Planctomycetaceae bacterium]